jgi:hypothetical protein
MTRTGQTSQHPTNCTIHRCTHSQTTNPNPTKSLEDQDFAPDKKKQPIIITWNSSLVASAWNAASSLVCSCISVSGMYLPPNLPNLPMASGLTSPAASVERRQEEERRREGGGSGATTWLANMASHDRFQKGTSRVSGGGARLVRDTWDGVRDVGSAGTQKSH